MKVRNFYPRQVLRKLQGDHAQLNTAQLAALKFVMLRGRKLGYSVMAGPIATPEALLASGSKESAQAVLANSPYRIALNPSI